MAKRVCQYEVPILPLPPGEGRGEGIEKRTLAKALRKNSTKAERLLWSRLRDRRFLGLKFRRQQTLGPYIADFLCIDSRLITEVDGSQHDEQVLADAQRTSYFEQLGYHVIRFWNHDVLRDIDLVLESVRATLIDTPSPQPSPGGRGS